jgi:hypothetical protein
MIAVFLEGEWSICVDARDTKQISAQDYFISFELSDVNKHAHNLGRRKHQIKLAVHTDSSRYRNGQKVVAIMRRSHTIRLGHSPYPQT